MTATIIKPNARKSSLMLSSAGLAMSVALALAPEKAAAQLNNNPGVAFNAEPTVVQGSATIDRQPNQDTVTVSSATAVIDWVPFQDSNGTAEIFLPADATGTFRTFNSDFAVLNRILPSQNGDITVFNGTVLSRVFQNSNESFVPGGTVAFYSPSGILIGSNAVFDVGQLILTTLEPNLQQFAGFTTGNTLNLLAPSTSTARIQIDPGAQITGSPENSFLLAAAPQIIQGGTVDINGSTAYIAATEVNVSYAGGLFNIAIPVGTTVNNAIDHTGTTTGPASSGVSGDEHVIYGVGAAQNDPIRLLFRGNLGFAPAQEAGIDNGDIILAANLDVSGKTVASGSVDGGIDQFFDTSNATAGGQADIFLFGIDVTSDLLSVTPDIVRIDPTATDNVNATFSGDVLLVGTQEASIRLAPGKSISIAGDALLNAGDMAPDQINPSEPMDINAQGGLALIEAQAGSTISIGGRTRLDASATNGFDLPNLIAGDAIGGRATIIANGGTINLAGDVRVNASADGSGLTDGLTEAGTFQGGTAEIFADIGGSINISDLVLLTTNASSPVNNAMMPSDVTRGGFAGLGIGSGGGTINVDGSVTAQASALAGFGFTSGNGADAAGGEAAIFTNVSDTDATGLITIGEGVGLFASATAGRNDSGIGGTASGGAARVSIFGGQIDIFGAVSADANATGGDGVDGGSAGGGVAGVFAQFDGIAIDGNVTASAVGVGGDAVIGAGGRGGDGTGGNAFVQAEGDLTRTGSITILGGASVTSRGIGGTGGAEGSEGEAAGRGGDGFGGTFTQTNAFDSNLVNGAYILAYGDNGFLDIGSVSLDATGQGGDGGDAIFGPGGRGGDGLGGLAQAGSFFGNGDGSVALGEVSFDSVGAFSDGIGGDGGFNVETESVTGDGGDGSAGGAFLTGRLGTVDTGTVSLTARGFGGLGNTGGAAFGGFAEATGTDGVTMSTGTVITNADAFGGDSLGFDTTGGEATAGESSITTERGGVLSAAALNASAVATGGNGFNGGAATAGEAGVLSTSGSITVGSVTAVAGATGGESTIGFGGRGGDAFGGTVGTSAEASDGAPASITVTGDTSLTMNVVGGVGGAGDGETIAAGQGGDAFGAMFDPIEGRGGLLVVANADGGTLNFSGIVDASQNVTGGQGGNDLDGGVGGDGGNATGGTILVGTFDPPGGATIGNGSLGFGTLTSISGQTTGGSGGTGETRLGDGGDAIGGAAILQIPAGSIAALGDISVFEDIIGGAGSIGGSATGGIAMLTMGEGTLLDGSFVEIATQANGGEGLEEDGGAAIAGTTTVSVANADLLLDTGIEASAMAFGGAALDGNGGSATGGTARLTLNMGAVMDNAGTVRIDASAFSGDSVGGASGNASGGIAEIIADASSMAVGGSTIVAANGEAGNTGGLNASAGDGFGGAARILAGNAATLELGELQIAAVGTGGTGPQAEGGEGTGGIAELLIDGAETDVTLARGNASVFPRPPGFGPSFFDGSGILVSSGFGGATTGGDGLGGDAAGGTINLTVDNGATLTFPNSPAFGNNLVGFLTRGRAGNTNVDGGTTGSGIGGTINILVDNGSIFNAPGLLTRTSPAAGFSTDPGGENTTNISGGDMSGGTQVFRIANGATFNGTLELISSTFLGDAIGNGTGGDGSAGSITLDIDGGTANLTGRNIIIANANGGGGGAVGGTGLGGSVAVRVTNSGALNAIADSEGASELILNADGKGGDFGFESESLQGGDGIGGTASLLVESGGVINAPLVTISAVGRGGAAGGVGAGNGTGGTATFTMGAGAGPSSIGTLNIDASGMGGGFQVDPDTDEEIDGGDGGDGTGGTAQLIIADGTLSLSDTVVSAIGTGSGNTFSATGGTGTGGNAAVELDGGTLTSAGLTIDASGQGGNGGASGGAATSGGASLAAMDSAISISERLLVESVATGGAGTAGGDAQSGMATVTLQNSTLGVPTGSEAEVDIASNALGGQGTDIMGSAISGQALSIVNSSTISGVVSWTISADADGVAETAGVSGDLVRGGTAELRASGDTMINVQDLVEISANADSSPGGDAFGGQAQINITAESSAIIDTALVNLSANASGEEANTAGAFAIELLGGRIETDSLIASATGDLATGPSIINAAGGPLLIAGNANINLIGDLAINTENGNIVGGPTASEPTANFIVNSGGLITLSGANNGEAITFGGASVDLTSADIDIQEGIRIGAIDLIFRPLASQNAVVIGGDIDEEGYTITQAEGARIEEAETVSLFAPERLSSSSTSGDDSSLIIRDLTVFGSQDNGVSRLELSSEGVTRVAGRIEFMAAAADDALVLTAAERLEIVTPDGGIAITDQDGNLSGSLTMSAQTIVAAVSDIVSQVADDPQFAGLADALASNDGNLAPEGYIRAGAVAVLAGQNIYVQNTGSEAQPGGITVGNGGLIIGQISQNQQASGGNGISFTGVLIDGDDVLLFEFTITDTSDITLRTYSYAGGTNAAGEVIPAGGFDPILALFGIDGALIGQNDDGEGVPVDPATGAAFDTLFQTTLDPGTYTVGVSAFSNFANGPNLSDGFQGGGSLQDRTPNFAFDILGANNAIQVGGGGGSGEAGPINVFAFGRREDGQTIVTGNEFFAEVDFGDDSTLASRFTEGSEFNSCNIINGCESPPVEPPPPPPPPAPPPPPPEVEMITNPSTTVDPVDSSSGDPVAPETEDSESDDSFGIDFPGLIDSALMVEEETVNEPVTSGGDIALYAVDDEDDDDDDDDEDDDDGDNGQGGEQ